MPDNIFNLLEPFIYLTEERSARSLEKVLMETLSELIDFESIILLRVPKTNNPEYLVPVVSIPKSASKANLTFLAQRHGEQHVEIDEWFEKSINFYQPVNTSSNGSTRAIFPIITNKVITGILDIYGYEDDGQSDPMIIALTRIYGNFLAIINDSEHDTLTNLLNRKTFDSRLTELLSEQQSIHSDTANESNRRNIKQNLDYSIGILDIDYFKKINDNYGHLYGDEVLLLFSNAMQQTFRSSDLLFRYGGEEFIVVLMNTTESDAFNVFDAFRKKIENFNFPQVKQVTVSIGMAKINTEIHRSALLGQIDEALYYAKEHGRNQVCDYNQLISDGLLVEKQTKNNVDLF